MKGFDNFVLTFPEMDVKKQESTLGGGYNYNSGGGGGIQLDPVTVTAPYYHPPSYDPTPWWPPTYNPGNPGNDGGSSGGYGDGYDPGSYNTDPGLHPEMVNHLMNTLHFATNLTQPQKDYFKKMLGELDKSKLGDKVLTDLDNYFKEHPDKIPTITLNEGRGNATFLSGTNSEYQLGKFFGNMDASDVSQLYDLVHEIYHNSDFIHGGNMNSLNSELDAYMYGTKVIQELYPGDRDALAYERQVEVPGDNLNDAQRSFNTAWENYLNGDTSTDNYTNLINNFHDGSRVGGNYDKPIDPSHSTPSILQPPANPANGSGGAGGSGDSGGYGGGSYSPPINDWNNGPGYHDDGPLVAY